MPNPKLLNRAVQHPSRPGPQTLNPKQNNAAQRFKNPLDIPLKTCQWRPLTPYTEAMVACEDSKLASDLCSSLVVMGLEESFGLTITGYDKAM